LKRLKLLYIVIIIAIVGIALLFIWRRHTAESRGENIENYINEVEGQAILEDEMNRLRMYDEIPPLDAYRDPVLEEKYMNLPFKVYYYNEDRLNEKTKQLLFGTGTAPIYERESAFKYPMYQANVYETQLPHNVPRPNSYDYLSWLDVQRV